MTARPLTITVPADVVALGGDITIHVARAHVERGATHFIMQPNSAARRSITEATR